MAKFDNTMEVFKLLKKNNCRKCNKPTCLAFAAAVFQGQASLSECPYVDAKIINKYGDDKAVDKPDNEKEYKKLISDFRKQIAQTDLEKKAETVGGIYKDNKLTIKILGKDFSIDSKGRISTDIHVNRWIEPVVYNYILNCSGAPLTGKWISFRELKNAVDWHRFFNHQCVQSFKKIADEYTNFFKNIIELFNGKQVENHYEADISLIILPLPKLPVLICYNEPEDGIGSDLKLFFDSSADKNFEAKDIYTICTGLAEMFKKLALTHG